MSRYNARDIALQVIYQVNEEGAYANLALDKALFSCQELDQRDRGLITEIVYGSIKNRGRLDYIINLFATPKVAKMDPYVRNIIRMALYQILFLDKIPTSAAVNEAVTLAKKYSNQGAAKFTNGVLRNIERNLSDIAYPHRGKQPVQYLSAYYSFPQWIIERWVKNYGMKNAENMCQYFNQPAPLWVRVNTLKTSKKALEALLEQRGIVYEESHYAPEGLKLLGVNNLHQLDLFEQGLFTVQDESSMMVAHTTNVKPGDYVLDVCSAPGGKTTHMAQLMDNKGKIIACDIHQHRLNLIEENNQRLGIDIVETRIQDGRFLSSDIEEQFDVILVDAPCSGLGVLGRRADARWGKRVSDIEGLVSIQKEILHEASLLLKQQGILIYSTCTTNKEENQEVVDWFLEVHQNFSYEPILLEENGGRLKENQGWMQLLPFEDHMDGFFIAKLVRNDN